jgi:hypothetical protein
MSICHCITRKENCERRALPCSNDYRLVRSASERCQAALLKNYPFSLRVGIKKPPRCRYRAVTRELCERW